MTLQIPQLPFPSPIIKAALAQLGADDQKHQGKSETVNHGLENECLPVAKKETLTPISVLLQGELTLTCASERRTAITECFHVSLHCSPFNFCKMHQTQNHWRKAKCLRKRRRFMSSIKGVTHLSRRAKRRLYCKLQLWMWRKRREKCRFWIFRGRKRACGVDSGSGPCLALKTQSQKNKKLVTCHTLNRQNSQVRTSAFGSPLRCDAGCSEVALRGQNGLLKKSESDKLSEALVGSSCSLLMDTKVSAGSISQSIPAPAGLSENTETSIQLIEVNEKLCHTVKPLQCTDNNACERSAQYQVPGAQRREEPEGAAPRVQEQTTDRDADGTVGRKKITSSLTDVCLNALSRDIQEFLNGFYRTYGSFIPLHKSDVLRHLKKKFNSDFNDWKNVISLEVARYRAAITEKPTPSYRVVYKKHIVTLEDLLTLADQNWLNDQVMNMYGELIMESSRHKVHFLNSFFHRQLMTKGYDGVKRWTKQVDLFSKSVLLVPIHLEVHWCLVTADIATKKICLYDSQGNALLKVARNILKYLMTEAREKQQTAFEDGWTVSYDEKIPQQTNENDCGVFVLEYSRCLALSRPFQFSQRDIPKIRKRIYKELCDCKLHIQD
ncbi:uncharacterized protein [Leuresthes tenuis]|uniref:uncharacterized protein n=1 Tax=Leuresthes tenuis TaxID=355514 RepID=UPI003B504C2B